MKLPNADKCVVEREKIVNYLLDANHRHGAGKAKIFAGLGFQIEGWERLAKALRLHGQTHKVKRAKKTGFGPRYEVEGALNAPNGRTPGIRSVWQWDHGEVAPRLITAYPVDDQ